MDCVLYDRNPRHERVKKDILGQQLHKEHMFFFEFYEIFQNGFFTKRLGWPLLNN